jgi:hypothetical protein
MFIGHDEEVKSRCEHTTDEHWAGALCMGKSNNNSGGHFRHF